MPKWQLLREVLQEIQEERQAILLRATASNPLATTSDLPATTESGAAAPGPSAHPPLDRTAAGSLGASSAAGAAPSAGDDQDASAGNCSGQQPSADHAGGCSPDARERLLQAAEAPVLVVVREPHLCKQLESVIREGASTFMQRRYEQYLFSKVHKPRASGGAAKEGYRRGRGPPGLSNSLETRGPIVRPAELQVRGTGG